MCVLDSVELGDTLIFDLDMFIVGEVNIIFTVENPFRWESIHCFERNGQIIDSLHVYETIVGLFISCFDSK